MRHTDQELLDNLINHYITVGIPPKVVDFPRMTYVRRFGSWNDALRLAGIPIDTPNKNPKVLIHCLRCNKETYNPKFCSRSCAATYNNKRMPKRKLEHTCKTCGILMPRGRTYCKGCYANRIDWNLITVKELKDNSASYNAFGTTIRSMARTAYSRSNKPKCCVVCGYDIHYQVAHILPVAGFDDSTTIATVNSLDNLMALCPNHHWEFDHGLLQL